MYNRLSLTTSMLLLTVSVGLVIWLVSDAYQIRGLNSVFRENLIQRFNEQSREQRLRFDDYVKSYSSSIKLYAENIDLHSYLRNVDWSGPQSEIVRHTEAPSWLPKLSSMRRFILPRYAMLIDGSDHVREIYNYRNQLPPEELINISALTLELSNGQSYLTMFGDKPYLLASMTIRVLSNTAALLIASPIDEKFLQDSQGATTDKSVIALLKEGEKNILVSSNEELVPAGTSLNALKSTYLFTGEGFFDSGSADIIVHFFSLTSTQDVQKQADKLLKKDRKIRAITAFAFITAFASVMYWITSRIQNLSRRVVDFSVDMNISQPDLTHNDEIMVLEKRFELLAEAVQAETQALEHQALHDPLTNIPNRKLLQDCLHKEIAICEIRHRNCVIMICDLDRFKEVNDSHGHHIGDIVLQQACKRLQTSLRKDDIVARMGGDEFCVLLKNTNISEAEPIAGKITDAFSSLFNIEDLGLSVGISIGVVEYPQHGNTEVVLMKHADVAMYYAKQNHTGYSVYKSSNT